MGIDDLAIALIHSFRAGNLLSDEIVQACDVYSRTARMMV
jgi:hypothetical protein